MRAVRAQQVHGIPRSAVSIGSRSRLRAPWRRMSLVVLLALPLAMWQLHAWRQLWAGVAPSHPRQQQQQQHEGQQGEPEPAGSQPWASADEVAAAARYLQAAQRPKARPRVPPKRYIISPEPFDMRQQHAKVAAHLSSRAFAAKRAARKAGGERGIIINAGGPQLLSSAIVTLKVLREVWNCSLPVELAWHTPSEMDPASLAALQARWGPIRGVDLARLPWPTHQRQPPVLLAEQDGRQRRDQEANASSGADGALPPARAAAKQASFIRKVQSLAASSFASALLLDADSLPLANPEGLWRDASYRLNGNLFWPDFWGPFTDADKEDIVCDMVGLETRPAMDLLGAGRGPLAARGTESGQVLFDLVDHADVAEWALWINSFGDAVYRAVWGDKDTLALAFAVAGKAHAFNQLQVPPGGAFAWRPSCLVVKATQAKVTGWQLAGMVQFDALGAPAFLHRTMNKLSLEGGVWMLGLMTGPLPSRWLNYYLSLEATGPTVGVPVTYAAPASAIAAWTVPLPFNGGQETAACPAATFDMYYHLRQHGVPLGSDAALDAACGAHLRQQLGRQAQAAKAAGLWDHPEAFAVAAAAADEEAAGAASQQQQQRQRAGGAQDSPVPAWVLPADLSRPPVATGVTRALVASSAALAWLRAHRAEFPVLGKA